jgi:two-component system sensor histidine kinase MprB
MTLRTKMTAALILLSALATASIGLVAYLSTLRQLTSEIDSSLRDVADYAAAQPGGHDGFQTEGRGAVRLQTVLVQELSSNGSVLSSPDGVSVPVTGADREVASRGSGELYRQVIVDGRPYRMLTAAGEHGAVQVLRPLSERNGVLGALRLRILLAAALVILAAAACGWLVSWQVTRRLRDLAAAAALIAETGRLDVAINTAGADETGQVARAFSRMLGALDRSQLAQRRLVQDAGHELRTPLTSLRTNLDVLARYPELDAEEQRVVVTDLQGETRELTLLVNELIDLSLGGGAETPPKEFALAAVAQRVVGRAQRRSSRPITLDPDDSAVFAVEAQVERALANLLDNAIKFSPDGAPIEVTIADGRVTVRDQGPGLEPHDVPRMFDRFYRSDRARQLPGSGLGLSIVLDLATRSGGSVFAGNHPTGGAAIGFMLPMSAHSNPALTPPEPTP